MSSAEQIVDGSLLRAFAAFAETLNFTHAARRVHLSQPALYERVQRLGELAGAPLYERTGRTARLTEAGQRLLAFARDTLGRGDAFLRELRGEERRAEVTLAAGEGSYLYLLGSALQRFERGSGATLHLLTRGAHDTAQAVLTGQADLGFTVLDPLPAGLVGEELLRAPMCAALPRTHRLAARATLRLADLAQERLILPPSGRLYRELVARFVAMGGSELQPPLEADGWPLMLEFVRSGLGVAIVNGSCTPPRGVVLRRLPELGVVRYQLLRRKGSEPRAAVSELAALLRAQLRARA